MILYLFTPLLFLLSAAAPLADDHSHSPALQKRVTACNPIYGHGIIEKDCDDALAEMRRMTVTTTHPSTGQPIPNVGAFSRFNPDGHYRLPQRFSVRTCTVLVDTIEQRMTLTSNWDLVAGSVGNVVLQCVHPNGIGGEKMEIGFNIVVLNEGNMSPIIRDGWQRCVNLINLQHRMDSFTQCLLDDISLHTGTDQGRGRITQRHARTVEDVDVL